MERIDDEELRLMDAQEAAKLCGMDRHTICHAMDQWRASKGQIGLAFVVLPKCARRKVRRSSLRRWFEKLEQRSCYV